MALSQNRGLQLPPRPHHVTRTVLQTQEPVSGVLVGRYMSCIPVACEKKRTRRKYVQDLPSERYIRSYRFRKYYITYIYNRQLAKMSFDAILHLSQRLFFTTLINEYFSICIYQVYPIVCVVYVVLMVLCRTMLTLGSPPLSRTPFS